MDGTLRKPRESEIRELETRPCTNADLDFIEENMRPMDALEAAASGLTIHESLYLSRSLSKWCEVALVDGKAACVFGIREIDGLGVPWMLGTNLIHKKPKEFYRCSKSVIKRMRGEFSILGNRVGAENLPAINWLRALGFNVDWSSRDVIGGVSFHWFEMDCEYDNQ